MGILKINYDIDIFRWFCENTEALWATNESIRASNILPLPIGISRI